MNDDTKVVDLGVENKREVTFDHKWIGVARQGGNVARLHTVPTLKEYKVSDHSFNACIVAIELCTLSKIDSGKVVRHILMHDVPEVYTGDVPAPIKREHESLSEELFLVENEWIEDNIPFLYRSGNATLSYLESTIVMISDVAELLFFCFEDMEMGNFHPKMIGVVSRALDYLVVLEKNFEGAVEGFERLLNHLTARKIELLGRIGSPYNRGE